MIPRLAAAGVLAVLLPQSGPPPPPAAASTPQTASKPFPPAVLPVDAQRVLDAYTADRDARRAAVIQQLELLQQGVSRNGVTSQVYGEWQGSFQIERAPQPWVLRLKLGEQGYVRITVLPGQNGYAGSAQHGIRSGDGAEWNGSFRIARGYGG